MKKGVLIALIVAAAGLLVTVTIAFLTAAPASKSNIIVGAMEQRVFKHITLENGLTVTLVSDPTTSKSAASMTVFAGAWNTLEQPAYIAEFLQHFLPLGSEKYPQSDNFLRFVSQHGGSYQASTLAEATSYAFDVGNQQFEQALDRFAQILIAPSLDSVNLQQARSTWNDLIKAQQRDSTIRVNHVLALNTNPDHPAFRLAQNIVPEEGDTALLQSLTQFFRTYYVANNMALSVVSPQPIDELEQLVNSQFSGLRSASSMPPKPTLPAKYPVSELPALIEIAALNASKQIEFRFPINNSASTIEWLPGQQIAYLLASEASKSLLAEVKAQGWATGIKVNTGELTHSQTEFVVSFKLTSNGVENWQKVGELLFAHLAFIRDQGVTEAVYQQVAQLAQLQFDFGDNLSALTQAQQLSQNMQYFAPERLLIGEKVAQAFNPQSVTQLLTQLQPDNVLVTLTHASAATDRTTAQYNVRYSHRLLGGNTVAAWRTSKANNMFALPAANPFLPSQTNVLELEREASRLIEFHPQRITNSNTTVVWFEQDDTFRSPKVDLHLLLETPVIHQSTLHQVGTAIYLQMVNDSLQDLRAAAQWAGSDFSIAVTDRGILLRVYGFADKMQVLVDLLVVELTEHAINNATLMNTRERFIEQLVDSNQASLTKQAQHQLKLWMLQSEFGRAEQTEAANKLTRTDLEDIRQQWLAQNKLIMLIHGNVTQAIAKTMAERIDGFVPQQGLPEGSIISTNVAQLPQRSFLASNVSPVEQGAILQYYQGSNSSLREFALFELLAHMMRRPFQAEIRDSELGYLANVESLSLAMKPGVAITIESEQIDAALLTLYSNRFYAKYRQQLLTMSDAEFNRFKAGLVLQLQERDNNLYELSSRYWDNILQSNANFNSRNRLAHEVKTISLDGFIRFFENQLLGNEVRNLTLHQVPQSMRGDYTEHMRSVVGLFPLTTPKNWPDDVNWVAPTFNNLER